MPVFGTPGLFGQVTQNTDLNTLSNVQDINNITNVGNGYLASVDDITERARIIKYFYDRTLLDSLQIGSENNVFLKRAKTMEVPKGHKSILLRRWSGLTEHTVPLQEGVPPISDRTASESFTATFQQYGRYMEFTDRVDYNLLDPIIAMKTAELADLMVRTMERICREEITAMAGTVYADGGGDISGLIIGDTIDIADYRQYALVFKRLLVKSFSGKFPVICSPEHIYDLVDDPLVQRYMELTQTASPYQTGKPVELFDITFEETQLDNYAYSYTEVSNPGEYDAGTNKALRLVAISTSAITVDTVSVPAGSEFYMNFIDSTTANKKRTISTAHLKNGSYIPNRNVWDVPGIVTGMPTANVSTPTTSAAGYVVTYITQAGKEAGERPKAITAIPNTALKLLTWYQLPVHDSFMLGYDSLIKTGISGESNVQTFIKPLGSAGTNDPINQRQSIGAKINAFGISTVRPEAMVRFVFVPKNALLTYVNLIDEYATHFNDSEFNVAKAAVPAGDLASSHPVHTAIKNN